MKSVTIWSGVAMILVGPVLLSAMSPLLAWREPVYVVAGLAGVIGLALIALQPLLIGGWLPGLARGRRGRRVHTWVGAGLIAAILVHVAGLWLTSPPDAVDALLFRSPAPFAAPGVIAMWAALLAAVLAAFRKRLAPRTWRLGHSALVSVAVAGTVLHAVLIEGTMEQVSKLLLCLFALAGLLRVLGHLRVWQLLWTPRSRRRSRGRETG